MLRVPFVIFLAVFPLVGNHPEFKNSVLAVVKPRFIKKRAANSKSKPKSTDLENHALAVVKSIISENPRGAPRANKKQVHLKNCGITVRKTSKTTKTHRADCNIKLFLGHFSPPPRPQN